MKNLKDFVDVYGIKKVNSFTKYPSIQTFHEIASGLLNETLTGNMSFSDCDKVYITEKVDGTNGRIIIYNGDYIIGSREDLLYHKGDICLNPTSIVDVMTPYAEKIVSLLPKDNFLYVFYGEVYGGNIGGGARNYSIHNNFGLRFFDIVKTCNFDILTETIDKISSWREHIGPQFIGVGEFLNLLKDLSFDDNNHVPYIEIINGKNIPIDRKDTYLWLGKYAMTNVALDNDANKRAEGVVVRNEARTLIRKIRFEDYQKTFRKLGIL